MPPTSLISPKKFLSDKRGGGGLTGVLSIRRIPARGFVAGGDGGVAGGGADGAVGVFLDAGVLRVCEIRFWFFFFFGMGGFGFYERRRRGRRRRTRQGGGGTVFDSPEPVCGCGWGTAAAKEEARREVRIRPNMVAGV